MTPVRNIQELKQDEFVKGIVVGVLIVLAVILFAELAHYYLGLLFGTK